MTTNQSDQQGPQQPPAVIRVDETVTAVFLPADTDVLVTTERDTILVTETLVIDSHTGATGPRGEAGPVGLRGFPGRDGAVGLRGPQGIQGVRGPRAERGPQGLRGDPGPRGQPGPEGEPGRPGRDRYIDKRSSSVALVGPQGQPGAPGLPGPPGADGPAGAPGSVWYTGSGVPAAGLGVVGDFYLNSDNADYYEKTGPATWVLAGSLASSIDDGESRAFSFFMG